MGGQDDDQLTSVFLKLTGGGGLRGDRRDLMVEPTPTSSSHLLSSRNRARRRERGDVARVLLAASPSPVRRAVSGILLADGHLGTTPSSATSSGWACRGCFSVPPFLAFSGVVTALSTFFLAEDLRLAAVPIAPRRLFHARFLRTVVQASWMVVIFLVPVLIGIGRAKCASLTFYPIALLTVMPFSIIPIAAGTAAA
jgi:hypothetical protein